MDYYDYKMKYKKSTKGYFYNHVKNIIQKKFNPFFYEKVLDLMNIKSMITLKYKILEGSLSKQEGFP